MIGHPVDDFLPELDSVYRHYDVFMASLPQSLQSLAASDKRLSARTMNRLHLLFPFWFMDSLGLSSKTCQTIACGNAYGLLHCIILDWIIDADEGLSSEWLLLGNMFCMQGVQSYLSAMPSRATDQWWTYMHEAMTQHTQGILWEKGCYKVEEEFADPEMLLMLRGGAMFQICSHTMALASGCDEAPALTRAINYFHAGYNIQDDIRDWQQDGRQGLTLNALLRLVSSDQGGSLKWEHISAALEKSAAYLTEAKRCIAHLNVPHWSATIDNLIKDSRLLKNKMARQLFQAKCESWKNK